MSYVGYIDLRLTGMFEARNETVSGHPRLGAMLELFQNSGQTKS